MATRFYLPSSSDAPAISPTPDAAWEDTSLLTRIKTSPTKLGSAMTTVSFADSDVSDKDILFRQFISDELTAGQTITGGADGADFVCRCKERTTGGNMRLAMGIRVLNGTTVQKTLRLVSRDDTEASATALVARAVATVTFENGDYTTVAGDRLVIEIGMAGDPSGGGSPDHDSDMRFGDAAATDLTLNDSDTDDDNPYVELAATLTFVAAGSIEASTSFALTATADLDAAGKLEAAAAVAVTIAADLDAPGKLEASASFSLSATADLDAAGKLEAAESLAFTAAADLDAPGKLEAVAELAVTVVADLTDGEVDQDIQASAEIALTVSADLDAPGKLEAAAELALTPVAVLTAIGSLNASGSMVWTISAELTDGATPPAAGPAGFLSLLGAGS